MSYTTVGPPTRTAGRERVLVSESVPFPCLTPEEEERRIAVLDAFDIVSVDLDDQLEDVVQLVSELCDSPMAMVSLVHRDKQFFKSRIGMENATTARSVSFCQHTIPTKSPFVVPDAIADGRFDDNQLVIDGELRSYIGVPLITETGEVLGALCAIDRRPRYHAPEVLAAMEKLGRLVIHQFESRLLSKKLEQELLQRGIRERQSELQSRALRLLAEGADLPVVLQAINDLLEFLITDSMCSVMLVHDGLLRVGAAGKLPPEYASLVDGVPIALDAGSCGSAAHSRQLVISSDLHSDPAWKKHRHIVDQLNVGACWSMPVLDQSGDVIATFAVYFHESRTPTETELQYLRETANYVRLCIQSRRQQDEVEQARETAVRASQLKSEFLANMSHEIRTPLNGVLGTGELLGQTELTSVQLRYLDTILSCGEGLLRILDDILDVSKIEAGKLELSVEPFDLSECVRSACGIYLAQAARHRIELNVEIDPSVKPAYLGDSTRVRQIVANITSNAIKFTSFGGVYVKLLEGARPGHVTIVVRDTGIGIAPDRLEAIFESFTQADGSTARQYGGSGLGLTIVRSLVNLMEGEIEIDSELNVGTTFRIHLPLPATNERVRSRTEELAGMRAGLGLRILLVEDNSINQMVAREALVQMGCEVTVCDSGEAALESFVPGKFRVVLLDIQMPGMDGFETARRLRLLEVGTGHRSAIIALSAHAMESVRVQALESGMDDHLAKPMRQRDLREVILRNLH